MGNLYWSCNDRFSLPGDDEDLVEGDSRPLETRFLQNQYPDWREYATQSGFESPT